ncbi:MAG: hypothetical protein ACREU0_06630, partial [Burkholderiales bacterium]
SRTAQDLSKRARNKNGLPARFVKKKRGYALERTAREEIKRLIDARPSKQIVSTEIMRLLSGLRSELRKNYLEEVYGCFQSNFLRAAIVLSWCVAFDSFREWLYRNHLGPLNSTMAKWKKPIKILNLEDFEYLTERTVIDTAKEAGIVGKETNKILVSLLDRRNSYAHPTGRTISISAAETYIEEVINEVVKKFP